MDPDAVELHPEPDWRKDPTGRHQYRMWDDGWTGRVSDFGVRSEDPYTGSPTAATLDTILGADSSRTSHRAPRRGAESPSAVKTLGATAVVLGGMIAAVGTLVPVFDNYPDFDVSYFDLPGYDDRGLWVVLWAAVVFLAGLGIFWRRTSRIPAIVAVVISTTLFVLVLRDWRDVDDALTKVGGQGLGIVSGLTICLIGAGLALLGAVIATVARPR